MKPRLPLLWGSLAGLLALVLLLGTADTIHAGTFNPQVRFCFDDVSTEDPNPTELGDPGECDGSNAAGNASTYVLGFDIPVGDVNFAALVTYMPNEWIITPGDEIPVGSKVGLLEAIATIGIINNQCDNILTLVGTAGFQLFNASIDINDNITFDEESGGDDEFRQDWAEDLDGNGLIEAVDKYPDFNNRVVKDEDDNPLQPIRRSAGALIIAGADVLIQYLIFEPGTFINKNLPDDPALGYPAVTLLQDIGDPDEIPEPGTITDFCTPLGAQVTNLGETDACDGAANDDPDDDDVANDGCPAAGNPETGEQCENNEDDDRQDDVAALGLEQFRVNDGCPQVGDTSEEGSFVLYRNPEEEGTYTITTIAVGQPDADGDGYENSLDTCVLEPNVGDPRIKGDGDDDSDGLDAACDPLDDYAAGGTNSDQDADGYVNRQDNCPLIANGENEVDIPDVGNQEDSDVDEDGDDQPDGIGDACDPEPLVFNGEPLEERIRTLETEVEIGPPAPGQETPSVGETPTADGDEGDDGGTSAAIFIIIGVAAAVVVVGGGAFFFLRRGGT